MKNEIQVTLCSEAVCLYVNGQRAELSPEKARELARELTVHADDVDAITQDALEQMS